MIGLERSKTKKTSKKEKVKQKKRKTSQFNNPQLALLQNHPSIRG